jgi:hypothetical protein
MRLAEYLSEFLILVRGQARSCPAIRDLVDLGGHADCADTCDDTGVGIALSLAADRARRSGAPGLVLMCDDVPAVQAFSRRDDALLERLECQPWEMLYLVHDEGHMLSAPPAARPAWLHCDAPPSGVRALALSNALLDRLLARGQGVPTCGPMAPAHWLGLLAWQSVRTCQENTALALWPPAALRQHP